MKLKTLMCSIAALALVAGGFTACVTEKHHEKKLEASAKITRVEAEKIAQAKVAGGTIKEGEIEKEKGKLIWSFDIATPGSSDLTEVQVDATTGDVVSVEKESPSKEAAEKKQEKDDDEKDEKK